MQTKKRAKSVTFGKTKPEPKERVEEKIIKEKVEEEHSTVSSQEKEEIKEIEATEEVKSDEVDEKEEKIEEFKQSIEEEPMEVHLSDEPVEAEPQVEEKLEEEIIPESPQEPEEDRSKEEVIPEEQPSPFGAFAKMPEKPESKKGNVWFFVTVMLITFALGLMVMAGIYYFTSNKQTVSISIPSISKPTPTAIPTSLPTATPKPLDLSAFSIKVLNGSGVTGEASKVKTNLTTAGFTVSTTGNADNSDYTKTVIQAKKSVNETFIQALITDLKKSYVIDSNIQVLSATDKADVVVIIGSSTTK